MQIAFHLGAHCTDEGAILRIFLKNRSAMEAHGIAVPDPNRYPALLQAAASAYAGNARTVSGPDQLLQALLPDHDLSKVERIVLSFEAFLAFQKDAVSEEQFYPAAARRVAGLRSLFPQDRVEFFLGLRNPATFLPALSARRVQKGQDPLPHGFAPDKLRWSELIERLRDACPDAKITTWCDEDTPVIWHRILREIGGHSEATELAGALDLPAGLMDEAGAKRLRAWFKEAMPDTDAVREKALSQFLERFAQADKLEMSFAMAGWTEETVEQVSDDYDIDCDEISEIAGVEFLHPRS